MNTMDRLLRWLGIGATRRSELKSAAPPRGLIRGLLPVLMLAGMTLAAQDQHPFWTEVNPDGTVTIFKTYMGWWGTWGMGCPTGALTIPETINDRKVTSIGGDAFSGCTGLTSVTIPDSVTSIGGAAFEWCTSLTSITIPDSVISIGGAAFSGCTGITNVIIGSGITSIGDKAFRDCPLGNQVRLNISGTMLFWCPRGYTGNYDIPATVTAIGGSAFSGCTGLTSVTIPDSVISIGGAAFSGCTGLTSVVIPGSVRELADADRGPFGIFGTFSGCRNLGMVTLRKGVSRISAGAFRFCAGLTNITIPDSVTSIGSWAFDGCCSLTSITLPDSVTGIGDYAFAFCDSPISVIFEGSAPREFWSPFAYDTQATLRYLPGTKGWTSMFADRPTAPWVRPNPTILDFGDRFGPTTNGFSFVISWATNVPVVVEATADISGAGWTPISTNTLTDGWVQFTDPEWKSQPVRFYRVRGH